MLRGKEYFHPAAALAIAAGVVTTYAIYGYRFGEGNHTIYLINALRRNDPNILSRDWFATQTFQYHALFGVIASKLMVWNIIEPAFATSYGVLVVAFHLAWFGIVRACGGGAVLLWDVDGAP